MGLRHDGADDADPSNPTVDFRGQQRKNDTHRSVVDPEARLCRKGSCKPAVLAHSGHVLMENRHGLCLAIGVDQADGYAERRSAWRLLAGTWQRHGVWPSTLGMDAGYSDGHFLDSLERQGVVPHVPMPNRPIRSVSATAAVRRRVRRRRHTQGYAISQRIRKRVEEIFGWCKAVSGLGRSRFVGRWKLKQQAALTGAAYNLLRMAGLAPAG